MKSRIIALCVVVLCTAGSGPVLAAGRRAPADGTPAGIALTNAAFATNLFDYDTPDGRSAGRGSAGVFFSVVKSLFIIALLCGGIWIFLRWLTRKQNAGEANTDVFRVIARHTVAPGRSLCVVRMLATYAVVAFSENSISLLREISDPRELEQVRAMEAGLPAGTDRPADFVETLSATLKGSPLDSPDRQAGSSDRILSFLRKQKDRLEALKGGRKR